MKAKISLISSTVILGMASLAASAEEASTSFSWGDVTFQPRAYVGYADYSLESGTFDSIYRNSDGSINEDLTRSGKGTVSLDAKAHDKLQINGVLWGIGGTIATGNFFGDFYYQSTLNDTAYSDEDVPLVINDTPINSYYGDVDAQHDDWALSLGYIVTKQWAIFAGYKAGNTEWDQNFRLNVRSSSDSRLINNGNLNASFDQDGPFLGTSYSVPIGPGALTFKAAYAYLDGTYKWSSTEAIQPPFSGGDDPVTTLQHVKLDGNSSAFSLGLSWTQSLSNNMGYSIGANYHRYKFDMSGASAISVENAPYASGQITSGSLTESLFTLTASLLYRF